MRAAGWILMGVGLNLVGFPAHAVDSVTAGAPLTEAAVVAAPAGQPSENPASPITVDQPDSPASKPANDVLRLKSDPVRAEGTSMSAATGQMVVGLAAVLAVIFGLAWLARRFNLSVPGASGNLKVISALSVGGKEKIMLLEVDNQRLLLGVTAQQISLLHVMNAEQQPGKNNEFADKMQAFLKEGAAHGK